MLIRSLCNDGRNPMDLFVFCEQINNHEEIETTFECQYGFCADLAIVPSSYSKKEGERVQK